MTEHKCMTYVYGATLRGTAEHVEWVMGKEVLPQLGTTWPDPLQSFQYSTYIAKKLFQGISSAVPSAEAAMRWLRNVAGQHPDGVPMQWRTPTNFLVHHDYQGYTDKRIRVNSCGVTLTVVRDWSEGSQRHRMMNAISPNFVHALDASHLTMVANRMEEAGLSMVAIHDSFGTHPADVSDMHSIIREEFVRMYSGPNLLGVFLWDVNGVGEPPQRGTLDLSEVLDSEFMFS